MVGEVLGIRSVEDLVEALVKARGIEMAFEEVLHWRGFLTMEDSEAAKVLETLVRDSSRHERMVDALLRIIHPPGPIRSGRTAPIVIDGEDRMQFLRKLLEAEDLAHYMYSTILDALKRLDPKIVGGEKNLRDMVRVLGELVSAEKRHRELVSKLIAAEKNI
jgi:rubrerythrin